MSNTIEKTGYTLPLGPIHPALHEPIRLDLSIDGEEIIDVDVFAGQVHRGIEWIGMNRNNPVQTIYLAERSKPTPAIRLKNNPMPMSTYVTVFSI